MSGSGYSGRQYDHWFPEPIGRLCKAWGVAKLEHRRARAAVVQDLYDYGQVDVLVAFKKGEFTWANLLQAKKHKRLGAASLASDLRLQQPYGDAVRKILPAMGKSEGSRSRYESALLTTLPGYAKLDVTKPVADLVRLDWPLAWTAMASLSPASRNRVRSAVSRFLTLLLGSKHHQTRLDVLTAMGPMEAEPEDAKDVSVAEFWTLMAHVPEPLVPSYVVLATTGMRIGEYLSCTERSLRRFPSIAVTGKEGARDVEVDPALEPIVRQAIPCRVAKAPKKPVPVQRDARYKRLYRALTTASEATGIVCTPHTLRHFYAAEGVERIDAVFVQHALGHKTPAMTARYAKRKSNRRVANAVSAALDPQHRPAHAS